jgi:hypothetical protein
MVGEGEFCLLGGNDRPSRKASANEDRS